MTAAQRSRRWRSTRITTEVVWFLASSGARRDPFPTYHRIRRLDRVHHSPIGVWILSGHAEVATALRDPRLSSDNRHIDARTLHLGPLRRLLGRSGESLEEGPFFDRVPSFMLFRDPPDHTRLRKHVGRSFTSRRIVDLEPRMTDLANALLAGIEADGGADFMARFAYPFPATIICELMGVPPDEAHHIIDAAPAMAAGLDPDPLLTRPARDAANTAVEAIVDYLRVLVERRRSTPDDDLISDLLATSDADDDSLTDEELIDIVLLLLIAGHETTANLLGNGLLALLEQPGALVELRANPALDAAAVDELLRVDSPVQMTMRVATAPVDIAGNAIEPGSVVLCCIGAANRDDQVFPNPDRLDWHRRDNPHLAFGGGIHHCLGAPLARTEARIALRAVLDRCDDLAVVQPPIRRPSFLIRGLSELHLSWHHSTPPAALPPRKVSSRYAEPAVARQVASGVSGSQVVIANSGTYGSARAGSVRETIEAVQPPTPGPRHTAIGLEVQLRDGSNICIRPITPADAAGLIEFHGHLSPESIRLRFFSPHPRLSSTEVHRFTDVDHEQRDALVAVHDDTIIGVGRYEGSAGSVEAEVAFVVADAWQHRGVATVLFLEIAAHARAAGLHRLVAETLAENHPMIDVFEHSGLPIARTYDGATIHYAMSLVDAAAN